MRLLKFCSLFTLLSLCACARLKMAYDLAPWYLEKEARSVLPDLNKQQSTRLKQDIQTYVRWHKREMLPAYTDALRGLASGITVTTGGSAQRLVGPLLNGLYAQTLEPLIRPSAVLLSSLSPEQIQAMRVKLDARIQKQRQEFLADPEKTFQHRFSKLLNYVEDYAGKLDPQQKSDLERLSRGFVIPYGPWINNKAKRQLDLIRVLSERRGAGVVQAHLRDWWLSPRSGGEGREAWQWDEKGEAKYVRDVLNLLNPSQRLHLANKLLAIADQLEAIVPGPEPIPKPGPSPQP